ncbi:MAG TPA: phosphoglycerate dehydrogenase [Candidatus Baltobacteraceae bacterium]|jgi:D-3-phosphoglycerate dehydrogenase|nr:phosphoglycerate dehydrogenase [Candidatus Baltobacteraceae bacterium]
MPSARVVIAEPFAPGGQAVLHERGIDVISCVGRTRDELLAALRDADGLIVRSETRVDRDLLSHAPRIRVVGRAGVGVDAIDVDAATEAGIVVVNTPAANTIAATEQTFALMLALMRHLPQAYASIRAGQWDRKPFIGNELFGKTLGIIGLGRIGGAVATRARAFGMETIAHDPYISQSRAEALQVDLVGLDDLLQRADIVTLHVPLTQHTRSMMDGHRFARMKPGAVLVNCARGGVIDEEALIAALDNGTLRAAAIDVIAHEPPIPGSSGATLHQHPRVIATPHLGGSTHEALERIAIELAGDVADALRGKPAAGAVNAPAPTGADAERVRAYVAVADRLGRLVPQLFEDAVREPLRLHMGGELAGADPRPLLAAFLAAFLQTTTERRVSIVNADHVAREVGVSVDVIPEPESPAFAAFVSIFAGAHRVTATVLSSEPRIVEIDGYELDAIPQGAWIVTHHEDVPGMVGRVGTILGDAGINISTMQVARQSGSDRALMVLVVDRPPEPQQLEALRGVAGMRRVDAAAF